MDPISIAGTALSAIGAAISIWQARQAKNYRDEIVQDRHRLSLVDAIGIARRAREECRKIVTPVGKPVRGIDTQQVINTMRDCIDRLKEHEHRFRQSKISQSIAGLRDKLTQYTREADGARRNVLADEMYSILGDIVSALSEDIDRTV